MAVTHNTAPRTVFRERYRPTPIMTTSTDHDMPKPDAKICAVVLAGGENRRMPNADKPLVHLANKALIQHVIDRIEPQVSTIVINGNGNLDRFSTLPFPCIRDDILPPHGPLGGIVSAMAYFRTYHPDCQWLLSAPADCPFLPENLVTALREPQNAALGCHYAQYEDKLHYLCALWPINIESALRKYIGQGKRSVRGFLHAHPSTAHAFTRQHYDPFLNINTEDDLLNAEGIAKNMAKA